MYVCFIQVYALKNMYMEPAFLSFPSYLPNIKLTYIELFKNQISLFSLLVYLIVFICSIC